jgi:hypothetical protein
MSAGTLAFLKQLFGSAWHVKGDDIAKRLAHVEGTASPIGSVTPDFIGQQYIDTTNKAVFTSTGTTNTSWVRSGSLIEVSSFSFTPAAGAANIANVTITPLDSQGNAMTGIREIEVWLSDAATGAGLTATTASGTVQAKSGEGTVLTALTAKKHILAQSKASGTFILEITDTAKTLFYVAVRGPGGVASVSSQLITGNYG